MSTEAKDQTSLVSCESAEGPTFLWLEFLDPRDGLAFASEVISPSVLPRWHNLTDAIPPKYRSVSEKFPESPSVTVIQRKDTQDFTGYLCKASGRIGGVMRAKRIMANSKQINMGVFANPNIDCGRGPNVYVISGHGAQGRVYGDGDSAGELFLRELKPDENLRILILPCCNNGAFSRMTLMSRWFSNTKLLAIFGYPSTYPGDAIGEGIFKNFGMLIRTNPKIKLIDAWKKANGSTPWSAAFADGAEGMTAKDIVFPDNLRVSREGHGKFYSSMIEKSPIDLLSPRIVGYFLFRMTPFIDEKTNLVEVEKDLNASIRLFEDSNFIEMLETTYLNIDTTGGEVYLFLRKADGEATGFSAGEEYLIKFYVVRPTWDKRLSVKALFNESILSGETKQYFSHCKYSFPGGIESDSMLVSVVEDCESLKIRMDFRDGLRGEGESAGDYLVSRASHGGNANPSDLVMSLIPIHSKNKIKYLPNSEKLHGDSISAFPWKDHSSVIDLRCFPCRLKPLNNIQF
ncbi:MAG TPA: hypothetical protein PKO15_17770 [Fibrobacteria bacterium]|nr:hypothetical protein [Fibrobacteria bacterium]